MTITPQGNEAVPYSFSFTTGSGPDTAAPQFLGFNPPAGATGVGIDGPFTALFNKQLGVFAILQGISVRDSSGATPQFSVALSADGKGVAIQPQSNGFTAGLQMTIDPTRVLDASGNHGQGVAQTASYSTFLATSLTGPLLQGFFPAAGQMSVPTNVSIRLLFDRVLDAATFPAGIQVTSNGAAVAAKYATFASGWGVAIQPENVLAPNQTYSVTVGAGLLDGAERPAQQAWTFSFTTGAALDTVAPQVSASGPNYGVAAPANVAFGFRGNKPIMPLAALEYTSLAGPGNPAAVASISPDGQTFMLVPSVPLQVGQQYSVGLQDVVDITSAPFITGALNATIGLPSDGTQPAVLAVSPPDGSQGVATSARIQVLMNKAVGIPTSANFVQLSSGGAAVPASVNINGSEIDITQATLLPNTTYTIAVNGITDLEGNVTPASSTQFTTGGAPSSVFARNWFLRRPQMERPASYVNTSITFTFSAPLSPLAAFNGFSVEDALGLYLYPATATLSGATLTITPAHALLANSLIRVFVQINDMWEVTPPRHPSNL